MSSSSLEAFDEAVRHARSYVEAVADGITHAEDEQVDAKKSRIGASPEAVQTLARVLLRGPGPAGSDSGEGEADNGGGVSDPQRIDAAAWPALNDKPVSARETLQFLHEFGSPATVKCTADRYFGFVTGGALPAALGANVLASAWDQNCFSHATSPVAALLEECALAYVKDVLGVPRLLSEGCFTTGATMANFACLCAARNAQYRQHCGGYDVDAEGLLGAPAPLTVFVSGEAHASIFKVLSMLGIGRRSRHLVQLPVDAQGAIQSGQVLPDIVAPAILILQAGNVNSGAMDPAEELVEWAHEAGAWVHVDGAFGLWALGACRCSKTDGGSSDAVSSASSPILCRGLHAFSKCDSWCADAHKWLNVPYDCGVALVRDGAALRGALSVSGAYLQLDATQRDAINVAPECSRRARAVDVWAALVSLGREGLSELIERNCQQARTLASNLSGVEGVAVLNEVVLNQVVVRFWDSDEATTRAVAGVQDDGRIWCSGSVWKGRQVMRVSFSSWATTERSVRMATSAISEVAARLKGQLG